MSYILDALRRAQADRDRGRLPGLQTQPVLPQPGSATPAAWPLGARLVAALAVLLVAAAALWWALGTRASAPSRVAAAPAPDLAPAPGARAVGAGASGPGIPGVPAPGTAPRATPAPPALPIVVSAPPAPPPPVETPVPASRPAAPAQTSSPSQQSSPPPGEAAQPAVTPLAALSPQLRSELPPLAISGSVWSENPAGRFVIVNGQLVHEGQTAAAGVVVERITQRSAVLRWRDRRIELPL